MGIAPLISMGLWRWIEENWASFEPPVGNKVIWEDSQFTAMVIRGPNRRRDFHEMLLVPAHTRRILAKGGPHHAPAPVC